MIPEVDGDGALVRGQCDNVHAKSRQLAALNLLAGSYMEKKWRCAQMVTIKITKCYNSAVTVVETEGSGGYEGIT
jgi:hypothetical protein